MHFRYIEIFKASSSDFSRASSRGGGDRGGYDRGGGGAMRHGGRGGGGRPSPYGRGGGGRKCEQ